MFGIYSVSTSSDGWRISPPPSGSPSRISISPTAPWARTLRSDAARALPPKAPGSVTPHITARSRTEELASLVALLRARSIPADHLASIAEEVGSAVELLRQVRHGEWTGADPQGELFKLDDQLVERARHDAGEWVKLGYDVRTVFDGSYPENLRAVFNRPPFVFVKGDWREEEDSTSVAVVGTRQASERGLRQAAEIAQSLAQARVTVISGLAIGIDAAAHEAALNVGGRTTAVLGTGIDRVYPAQHAGLAKRIAASSGALMSQFLPEQPPTRWTFPKRNVVMSGLSLATVVVEASWTSGARVQATEALRHGRTVYLLLSLVESHEWARKYVEDGYHDVHAIVLKSVAQLIDDLCVGAAPAQH